MLKSGEMSQLCAPLVYWYGLLLQQQVAYGQTVYPLVMMYLILGWEGHGRAFSCNPGHHLNKNNRYSNYLLYLSPTNRFLLFFHLIKCTSLGLLR